MMIRKPMLAALAIALCFSAVGCSRVGNDPEKTEAVTTTSTTDTTDTTDTTGTTGDGQSETRSEQTISLKSSDEKIRILGVRNLASDAGINADWTCSGIEFTADLEGEISFALNSSAACYFRLYVDDEACDNNGTPYFTVNGPSQIKTTIEQPGVHTIRLIKVTGYTIARAQIKTVSMTGFLTDPPADCEKYIEFVGDSITCGWGTLAASNGEYAGTYESQDGTLAYPYIIASTLNADYSMTALSGQGICYGNPGIPLGYRYACYAKDSVNKYEFARKADMVVINIGTNDFTQNVGAAQFLSAFRDFVKEVRTNNGENCKIVAVYNVMNDTYASQIVSVFRELGGEANGYFTKSLNRCYNPTAHGHPSIEQHREYSETLLPYLSSILDGTYETQNASSELPENSVYVSPSLQSAAAGSKAEITIGDKTYNVTVGYDAFGTLSEAHTIVPANGTIYLGAGTYSETFYITKNITVMGPKAGIDPNVKPSDSATSKWTMNPLRGSGEAEITANWHLGVNGNNVLSECNNIAIDGIAFTGAFLMRNNCGAAGKATLSLSNIYVHDVTTANNMIFFYSYYPTNNNPNAYQRTVNLENFRIEGLTTRALCRLNCESFTAKGIYMDEACTKGFVEQLHVTSSSVGTAPVSYSVQDSMFCNKNVSPIILSLRSDVAVNKDLPLKESVSLSVSGCVFANNFTASGTILPYNINTQNVKIDIQNNTFVTQSGGVIAISDSACAAPTSPYQVVIKNNTFTGFSTDNPISLGHSQISE